ncbi:MAG: ATP-binding protein [Chthonomonadales bacterium]
MTEQNNDTSYLRTLLQLGATLNVTLELSQVLNIAIEQVVKFVKAERGFILLVDSSTNKVWGKASHGIDLLDLESALTGKDETAKARNVPQISRTIVEEALRDRRSVISTNAMEDPRYSARTSVQLSHVRSVLCVPLIAQGQCLGIVYIDNRVKSGIFEQNEAEMLTAFANQAAVAIQNARLYENLRKSSEERLKLQQELHTNETRRLALEEANKLKSDFIGYISHELRNPLTTIRGYVQTIAQDEGETLDLETRAEFYETIEAEADRMLTLINELLDSSRLEAGRPLNLNARPIQVKPILERLARAQRYYKFWTSAHQVVIDIDGNLPEIEADADKVLQIATNLLSNAIKYSPEGGKITLAAHKAKGGVEISVSDDGIGLTEEQRAQLFGKYERIDRDDIQQISGTGLGLYLTKHLVDLHGGEITVESNSGQGSTFRVFLPLKAPLPPATK